MTFAGQRVLVVSPHTDDAELACGASIAMAARTAAAVRHIAITACEHPDTPIEFARANTLLGVSDYAILETVPRRLFAERRQRLLDTLLFERSRFKPTLCLIPNRYDRHQDHAALGAECVRAFWDVPEVWAYEQPWNDAGFSPTKHVAIDDEAMARKCDAVSAYQSQAGRSYAHARFVAALAVVRGVQSGTHIAEAFRIERSTA